MIELKDYEVWFVTGSQELYGEETLKKVAEDSQEIASGMTQSRKLPVRVVFKPVVTSSEAIYALCTEANNADNCIGLITWMHTFSPAKMWIAGLKALQKPFLHLHTQFNRDLPWSSIDMDFMNLNQSAHGDREFGFIGSRMRLERKIVVGFWQDDDVLSGIATWMRAAAAWHDSQGARVARFGDNMREVAVTEGDKVEAQLRLGYSVNGYGVGDLVKVVNAVSEIDVDRLVAEYDDSYAVSKELQPKGSRRQSLREAARIELGMRSFLEKGGFKAFTTTFEDLNGLAQLPGLGRPAPDGRWLWLWCRRRLEDGCPGARHESHGRWIEGRHLLHGRLHLPLGSEKPEGTWRAYARGLRLDCRIKAQPGDPPAIDRRQGRSGPVGIHCAQRTGGQCHAARYGQPLPHGGE